jgi:hypothetical protein
MAFLLQSIQEVPQLGNITPADAPILNEMAHERHGLAAGQALCQILQRLSNDLTWRNLR